MSYSKPRYIRWGIAGTGKVSTDFVNAIRVLTKKKHDIVAVGSTKAGRAEEFAKTFRIPRSYEDYVGLSTDSDVDVVYVAVVTVLHYEVSKTMLSNGKHVLCEMPLGLNAKQVRKLIELAKSQNRLLIEGIWSRFFPIYRAVKDIISHGTIGEVVQVSAEIGYSANAKTDVIKAISGVSILELALYLLQLQQIVFDQTEKPNLNVCTHITQSGLDSSFAIMLVYPNDKMCMLCLSTVVNLSGDATIYGTAGYIKVKDFWCPTSLTVNGSTKTFPLLKNPFPFNYHNGAGYAYEAEEVRSCILAGKIESQLMTHDESLILIKLLDEMRLHIGATFPEDFADIENIGGKDNQ